MVEYISRLQSPLNISSGGDFTDQQGLSEQSLPSSWWGGPHRRWGRIWVCPLCPFGDPPGFWAVRCFGESAWFCNGIYQLWNRCQALGLLFPSGGSVQSVRGWSGPPVARPTVEGGWDRDARSDLLVVKGGPFCRGGARVTAAKPA